ncbi:MAG TPA: hypothetical protein PLJ35_15610 [Anaerolineae bacterium]|nr:hypothetical protein [Anaerolineae bacterium]HOR00237.1 hypothetical protein [Anaerolineae bacterium]HPL28034.1 hypothetical protein [Anaerolineae bacterium]
MRKIRPSSAVFIAITLVIICTLTISFLPFFVEQVWPPLWDATCQPRGASPRGFAAVGPFCSVWPWPALLAVPISSALLVVLFMLVAGVALLRQRQP